MTWNHSDVIGLAPASCTLCRGAGLKRTRKAAAEPCPCALRAIFRACHDRFRHCAIKEKHMSRVVLERTAGPTGRRAVWGRKDEEYMADFILVSRRTLTAEEHRIFRFHFLLGADWRLCCRRLGMDRGNFFHAVYRIQAKLGRVFRELQPYGLYPLDEYFNGCTREREITALPGPGRNAAGPRPVVPPLRRSA